MFVLNLAKDCGPLPLSNFNANTSLTTFPTNVHVVCESGHVIREKSDVTVTCDVDGEWRLDGEALNQEDNCFRSIY